MPAWTQNDRDQYEAIKQSELKRGESNDTAEEIAARTVNKRRRQEGRTPSKRTQGTGNPNRPLDQLTRNELYNRAKEAKTSGRSKMSKAELVASLGRVS